MKFANVKDLWVKEAKKALRGTREEGMTNVFAAMTIGDSSMVGTYALYEAAHAVGMFNESLLVYAYVRGLMDKEDMYVKYMPVLRTMENDLHNKKTEKVFNAAIDYINGNKDTDNSLIKAVATFYKVAKD